RPRDRQPLRPRRRRWNPRRPGRPEDRLVAERVSQTCYSRGIAGVRYTQAPGPCHKRVQEGYTTGARTLASRSVRSLARTRVTPNALTTAGVSLCIAAAVLVPF